MRDVLVQRGKDLATLAPLLGYGEREQADLSGIGDIGDMEAAAEMGSVVAPRGPFARFMWQQGGTPTLKADVSAALERLLQYQTSPDELGPGQFRALPGTVGVTPTPRLMEADPDAEVMERMRLLAAYRKPEQQLALVKAAALGGVGNQYLRWGMEDVLQRAFDRQQALQPQTSFLSYAKARNLF